MAPSTDQGGFTGPPGDMRASTGGDRFSRGVRPSSPWLSRVLLLVLGGTARAGEPFSVVALGQADVSPPAAVRTMPGQLALHPGRSELPSGPAPGVAVLVDGRTRLLIDPVSGTLSAARVAGLDLTEVSTVLLGSMRPASAAELPTLLARPDGPPGQVRLVGP